jgi:hypothetical protein
MSYILNALKKAEQDRLREEPQDLDDFVNSGWDPYEKTRQSSSTYWLPIGIVVIAAGLFYGFANLTPEVEVVPSASVAKIETVLEASPISVAAGEEYLGEELLVQELSVTELSVTGNSAVSNTDQIPRVTTVSTPLPDVTITGHIFIRASSRLNQIFVGEHTYHVGDKLDPNWVIEAINSDSLELRSGTQTTELPLR